MTSRTPTLRISRIVHPVTTLGPGRRLVVWLQGCALACPGCMSRDTWDPRGGVSVPVPDLTALLRRLAARGTDGLTISGGEPLDQAPALADLLAAVPVPGADVLVYTGYETDEAFRVGAAALRHADAVITGRYDAVRPTRLVWRGSANQSLHPLTDLGRRRYSGYLEQEVTGSSVEVLADGESMLLVGVPRKGELRTLEKELAKNGVVPAELSWRPSSRPPMSSPRRMPPSRATDPTPRGAMSDD
jgi:anaerobic ribonucleoside-triphosphate reductase activating protein